MLIFHLVVPRRKRCVNPHSNRTVRNPAATSTPSPWRPHALAVCSSGFFFSLFSLSERFFHFKPVLQKSARTWAERGMGGGGWIISWLSRFPVKAHFRSFLNPAQEDSCSLLLYLITVQTSTEARREIEVKKSKHFSSQNQIYRFFFKKW